jgi:hypothetical protein
MGDRRLMMAVFGVFAGLGAVIAIIGFAVASRVEHEAQHLFRVVAVIGLVLAVSMGFLAVAAWRRWWPLRSEDPLG